MEALYFLAPNAKQRFLATLPGAILAVGCWIGLSYLLGVYFRHFANFNKTYGTLGAAIALMVWLYWTGGGFSASAFACSALILSLILEVTAKLVEPPHVCKAY